MENEAVTSASEPFHLGEGDVILRSCDGVDFHVYKVVLSLASPFFKSIFSLQQPSDPQPANGDVIPVAEDRATLESLLRYCYPIRNPCVQDLKMAELVLAAAIKYDMDEPSYLVKQVLRELMVTSPLQAFAISCRHDCEEEARLAAEIWKDTREIWNDESEDFSAACSGSSYIPEMGTISAGSYHRLLEYLRGHHVARFCSRPWLAKISFLQSVPVSASKRDYSLPPYDADLVIRSADGADFKVHKLVLRLCMPRGADAETHPLFQDSDTRLDGVPVVTVPENRAVIMDLLDLCYPPRTDRAPIIPGWTAELFCGAIETIRAAQKYNFQSVIEMYLGHFEDHLPRRPLELYCIAAAMDWDIEGSVAAEAVALGNVEVIGYVPMMEELFARDYHRLLSYCHRYRQAMFECMSSAPYKATSKQWRKNWFNAIGDGKPIRTIPSVLIEGILQSGSYLKALAERSAAMEDDVRKAVKKVWDSLSFSRRPQS